MFQIRRKTMKKLSVLFLTLGLLLAAPGLSSAQPGPRGPHMGPPPPPSHHHPYHHHIGPPPPPHHHHHIMPPPPPPPPGPMAMPRHEFDKLVHSLRHGGPYMNRVERIRMAARHHWFTCRQVSILMEQLMMEGERVDAACSVQHRIVDPHNIREIHRALRDPRSHHRLNACWRR